MAASLLNCAGRIKRLLARYAVLCVLALGSVQAGLVHHAAAHARLKRANPPVGGVMTAPAVPPELELWFSEPVEPALSSVEVRAGDGSRMDKGDLRGDAADRTRLRLTLLSLPAGSYRVLWRVVSVDTHRTNGSFPFRVEP